MCLFKPSPTIFSIVLVTLVNQHQHSRNTRVYYLPTLCNNICITGCSLSDLALTDTAGQCADRGFTNTLHISSGVVCYNRTTAGSEAVYSCDYGFHQDVAEKGVCQSDGEWNGSMPQCLQDPGHDGTTYLFVYYDLNRLKLGMCK